MPIHDTKTGLTLQDSQVPFAPGALPPRLEKQYMNPIRYRVNYRIVPGFALFSAGCLALALVLMSIDDKKYTPAFLVLLGLVLAASILLLLSVPKTRKAEMASELGRYDFEVPPMDAQEPCTLNHEGAELAFEQQGLRIDGEFYWYSHLKPVLVTSNRFNRVWIAVRFGTEPLKALYVPLCPQMLRAVQEFDIPISNREKLVFLLKYKENAFAQIYSSGNFQVFSYD